MVYEVGKEYSVYDLCQYNDVDFIIQAYRVILQREPSLNEIDILLPKLRAAELTKKEILGQFRFSKEGREKNSAVRGLLGSFIMYRFFRIPILGRLLRIIVCVVHLPFLFRNIQASENIADIRYKQSVIDKDYSNNYFSELERKILESESKILKSESKILESESKIQILQKALFHKIKSLQEIDDHLGHAIHETGDKLTDVIRQIQDNKLSIDAFQRCLDNILSQERNKLLPKVDTSGQVSGLVTEQQYVLDAMYLAFENRFRGTREVIKKRQSIYLPYVKKVLKGKEAGGVLDVGSGRGEWLEILTENKYKAKGIDLNSMMVALCRELSLDVDEADLMDYFINIASDSLSVVTGFHIVEHLPLNTMLTLFDQALRVLKPGGMVIFETPNPENIIVGSCNFYYDPTHKNPIPPETLSFLLEARGYQNIEIVRLHENNFYLDLKETDISEKITSRFLCAQDYSVIGYKL